MSSRLNLNKDLPTELEEKSKFLSQRIPSFGENHLPFGEHRNNPNKLFKSTTQTTLAPQYLPPCTPCLTERREGDTFKIPKLEILNMNPTKKYVNPENGGIFHEFEKKFYSKWIIDPQKTTMSIRKAKINRYKAEQLKKMKNDIKNMFKFFKEVKKSDEDDSLSDSLTSKESETDNLNSVKKDLYIQRRSSSQVFTKPRRMSYIRTKSPVVFNNPTSTKVMRKIHESIKGSDSPASKKNYLGTMKTREFTDKSSMLQTRFATSKLASKQTFTRENSIMNKKSTPKFSSNNSLASACKKMWPNSCKKVIPMKRIMKARPEPMYTVKIHTPSTRKDSLNIDFDKITSSGLNAEGSVSPLKTPGSDELTTVTSRQNYDFGTYASLKQDKDSKPKKLRKGCPSKKRNILQDQRNSLCQLIQACDKNETSAKKDVQDFEQTHHEISKMFTRLKQVNHLVENEEVHGQEVSHSDSPNFQEAKQQSNRKFFTKALEEKQIYNLDYDKIDKEQEEIRKLIEGVLY